MSNIVSALTYAPSVEAWGSRLRVDNSLISIPIARLSEKMVRLGKAADSEKEMAIVQRFTLLLERTRKTVERVTLLKNVKQWPTLLENSEIKAQFDKICPAHGKLDETLASQTARLDSLQRELLQWTLRQPKWQALPEEQIFQMVLQVLGTLTSKIKWIQDPMIPFIKLAIEERAKWLLSTQSLPEFMDSVDADVEPIFSMIPDMYYNTFLGANHPKVQANIRNKNDLVAITPEDVKEHILDLLLKPLEDRISLI